MNDLVVKQSSMAPKTFDEALRFADMLANSSLAPKDFKGKPGDVLIAIQMGAELGLQPMAAIQNIAVINGRPTLWGDALLAICRNSRLCKSISERFDPVSMTATCTAIREGEPEPFVETFSQKDAEQAGLWSKPIWKQYPKRMLKQRARNYCLRDAFADILKGLHIEGQDDKNPETAQNIEPITIETNHEKDRTMNLPAGEPEYIPENEVLTFNSHKHWKIMVEYFEAKPENLEVMTGKKTLEELALVSIEHWDYVKEKISNAQKV